MARTPELKRFRRHLAHRQKRGGLWCVLCGEAAASGCGLEWLDPAFVERGPIFFVLCSLCSKTNYTEQLNRKHREAWRARHGT